MKARFEDLFYKYVCCLASCYEHHNNNNNNNNNNQQPLRIQTLPRIRRIDGGNPQKPQVVG